ncbi:MULTISPECIES: phage tail tip lysozyme [unclassified Phaeobacter]|uniref:phage tail tip lysozyme n=1 Tax=unclassified Phaeobacter TaxID=2621772 RepID=UPI003A86B9A8
MATAQDVINGLIARGMPRHMAIGVAGNMQIESDGFQTGVNEYAPVVPGSRGGYGLNQWTGPRRRQFESYAADRGVALDDLDAQLDFTMWELENTEKRAAAALSQAQTPAEAARIYSEKFLRPGIPHLDRRIEAANALAGMDFSAQPSRNALSAPVGPQSAPMNVLAQQQTPQPPQMQQIDPRNFLTQVTPRAKLKFT